MYEYAGDFEVHLTVEAGRALSSFERWCRERGMKCVRIVLARGRRCEQPMATWRRRGTCRSAMIEEAHARAAEARAAGWQVVRVKLETAPGNEDVPATDEEAQRRPEGHYFEHHVKLRRPVGAGREGLLALCQAHGAHLSRNALRLASEGHEERFVTLRTCAVGRASSLLRLDALIEALDGAGEHIEERESEYCVYDTNLALDEGWLSAPS